MTCEFIDLIFSWRDLIFSHSIEGGRIAVQLYMVYDPSTYSFKVSCNVTIQNATERDNGEWKGVIVTYNNVEEYHEYTQDVNVVGKC